LLPGDLLTFGKGKKGRGEPRRHYVGDGRFVRRAAPRAASSRRRSTGRRLRASKVWRGARRILVGDDSTASTTPPAVATKRQR
jgi:hypothetical protein